MVHHTPGGFYGGDPPSKDVWIHTRLGIGKTQCYAAKTRENSNWWAFLSTRETAYWSSTRTFVPSHQRENQHNLKNNVWRAIIKQCKFTPVTCTTHEKKYTATLITCSNWWIYGRLTRKKLKTWKIKFKWQSQTKIFI